MMDSILRNQKTFQSFLWNDSFDDTRRRLLPTQFELQSLRLLCALLAPFLDATNVIEGQTYVTASMTHRIVQQLHSDPLEDRVDVWLDDNTVERVPWAQVCRITVLSWHT